MITHDALFKVQPGPENIAGNRRDQKAVSKGKKVALFCFNTNLGEWMKFHFSNMRENLHPAYVGTFHKYMLKIIKEKVFT